MTVFHFQVYCDQETDSGGWTVFQRRQDGSVDFYRTWQEYKAGFGDPHGEFWLGNDNIILLLSHHCCHELRIELQDFDNNTRYAKYGNFSIGPESTNYTLTAEECVADTSVSFGYYHSGYQFSTRDRDNDVYEPLHCAQSFKGGWWYRSCINANLNGLYLGGEYKPTGSQNGVVWQWWRGRNYSLKFMEMKWREKV